MDAVENLVGAAEVSAVVLGRAGQFEIVYLDKKMDPAHHTRLTLLGYRYAGVLAILNGRLQIEGELDSEAAALILAAVPVFVAQSMQRAAAPEGDSGDWLERLHRLEDPRG